MSPEGKIVPGELSLKRNLKSETVGDEDGLDLDMLIDQETALKLLYKCIMLKVSHLIQGSIC